MAYPDRSAFFTCYNRETIKRAAFYAFHRMKALSRATLGYIAIVERSERTTFHAPYGMA